MSLISLTRNLSFAIITHAEIEEAYSFGKNSQESQRIREKFQ